MITFKAFYWWFLILCFHGQNAMNIIQVLEPFIDLQPFELNEILQGVYQTKSFNASWISETNLAYLKDGSLYSFDIESKEATVLVPKTILAQYPGASPIPSRDTLFVALRYNVSSIFRHSTTASYAIYDIKSGTTYDIEDKKPIQTLSWGPIGHTIIYVKDNNIYYLTDPTNPKNSIPVTKDGVPGVIYNGVPDWVYEEEVLASGSALWFSDDGTKFAFAQFNDTEVLEFDYVWYGEPGDPTHIYPEIRKIRYPKVNTTNPSVKTFVVDLTKPDQIKTQEIEGIPARFLPDNYVLFDIIWANENEVSILSQNRIQNEGELTRCNIIKNTCTQEATYKEENGWLDSSSPMYNKEGTTRIEIVPQPEGDDTYNQIVSVDVASKKTTRLTSGKFVVTKILGYDESKDMVYYQGSREGAISQEHVYSVDSAGTKCMSCSINSSAGPCTTASALFNKNYAYYIRACLGPGPHLIEIMKRDQEAPVYIWEDNKELVQKLLSKALPLARDLKVPIAGGFEANVRLLLPYDFDENEKYPAIVYVYGGPDSNQINDAYSSGFQNYFVSNRRYIYILIDGRGSGRDGNNKKFQIYKRMGTVEIEDQIAVTKYLQQNFPFIDSERTGVWGWSYGGYATGRIIAQDVDHIFCFGLSVAPVTNWLLYDSIYTERYMRLPTRADNLEGYRIADLLLNVDNFRGRQYMLIHGNADDNVHYQQSMLLSRGLEEQDIAFKQQSYPDENHSLGGVSAHLYHTIDRFWARSFGLPDPPAPPLPLHPQPEEKIASLITSILT